MEVDNGKEFYLVLVGGKDDTTQIDWDGNVGFKTKLEAVEYAKEFAVDGGSVILFRCCPVDCIERGPVRVKPIKVGK